MFAYNDVHNPIVDKKIYLCDFSKIIKKNILKYNNKYKLFIYVDKY